MLSSSLEDVKKGLPSLMALFIIIMIILHNAQKDIHYLLRVILIMAKVPVRL
jgi:hypothetical protein